MSNLAETIDELKRKMITKADDLGKSISSTTIKVVDHVDAKYKVKESLVEGAVKSYKYAKSIDDHYQISSMTTQMAVSGQKVFTDVRERDPTGVLSLLERYTVTAWEYVLGYTGPVLEHAAALVKEENVTKKKRSSTIDPLSKREENRIGDLDTEIETSLCTDSQLKADDMDYDVYSV